MIFSFNYTRILIQDAGWNGRPFAGEARPTPWDTGAESARAGEPRRRTPSLLEMFRDPLSSGPR